MATDLNNENVIERYLLGELPEEQQVEIEDRAFTDKEYFATITAVENDLIDEYVRMELSETDRQRFEGRFLASANRRKRIEFAKSLAKISTESVATERQLNSTPRVSWRESLEAFFRSLNPAAKFAMAVVTLFAVAGAAWLTIETLRLRNQLAQLQADSQTQQSERESLERQVQQERQRNEELAAQLDQEKQQRQQTDESLRQLTENAEAPVPVPQPVIASLTLLPGISRGGTDKPNLVVPANARLVRLQIGIDPEEPYKTFAVELRTEAGRQVWTRANLTARARRGVRAAILTLPATVLQSGAYELRLSGVAEGGATEDVGFYYFDVTRR